MALRLFSKFRKLLDVYWGAPQAKYIPVYNDQLDQVEMRRIGLSDVLSLEPTIDAITTSLSGKASTSHTHAATDITSGILADAQLSSNIPKKNAANTFTATNVFTGLDTGDNAWTLTFGTTFTLIDSIAVTTLSYNPLSGVFTAPSFSGSGTSLTGVAKIASTNTFTAQNTFAAGTITTSQPFTITQTWNAGGVTFNGFLVNCTSSASASGSTIGKIQIGGSDIISIDKDRTTRVSSSNGNIAFILGIASTSALAWYAAGATTTPELEIGAGGSQCYYNAAHFNAKHTWQISGTQYMQLLTTGLSITGGLQTAYVAKSTTYTLTASEYYVAVSGNITITLPTAVGCAGRRYVVKKIDSGTTVTIATTSSQTIDGAAPGTLTTQWSSLKVFSNGANWLTE